MNVDLSDLSHSYPFLHLSRKFEVAYSEVLRIADVFDYGMSGGLRTVPSHMLGISPIGEAVLNVCRAPWRWKFPPEGKGL
jgi:hypothetical protein